MSAFNTEEASPTPRPLKFYYAASLIFTICCVFALSFWRFVKHLPFPYNSTLITGPMRDFWCYRHQYEQLHTRAFFQPGPWEMFPYPPGSALPFAFFQNLLPKALPDGEKLFHLRPRLLTAIAYLAITLGGVAALGRYLSKGLQQLGVTVWKSRGIVLTGFLLMFPFQFVVTTGNIEIVIFLALAFAVTAFLRGHFTLAAILIGFAGSMKFYPLIMVALFLPGRRWKEIGIAIATFIGCLLAGLWLMCPDVPFSLQQLRAAMTVNRMETMQMYLFPQTMADHSLFGFFKSLMYLLHGTMNHGASSISLYTGTMAVLGLLLYGLRIRHLPLLNQIFCLYLSFLLLVPESFEYTLIHLSVPWALMVLYLFQRQRAGRSVSTLTPVFLCFALVLSAQNELVMHGVGYWGQAKCLMMICLFGLALAQRWEGFDGLSWVNPKVREMWV